MGESVITAKMEIGERRIVFVTGAPGTGKGTQCLRLVEELGVKHISLFVEPDEWDELMAHIKEQEVNILFEARWPEAMFNVPGGIGVAYITDPDGIPIELQEAFHPGQH